MGIYPGALLVAESSCLMNFLRVGRLDLLSRQVETLYIVEEVNREVVEPVQRALLDTALQSGQVRLYSVTEIEDIALGARLREEKGLGSGEAYSFPAARRLQAELGIDDQLAIKRARVLFPTIQIISTSQLVVRAIQQGILDVAEADTLLLAWYEKGPRFPFRSFADLLNG